MAPLDFLEWQQKLVFPHSGHWLRRRKRKSGLETDLRPHNAHRFPSRTL